MLKTLEYHGMLERSTEPDKQVNAFIQELADMCEWKDGRILDVTGDVRALQAKYPLCRVGLRRAMLVAEKRYGEAKKADQQ